jgi:hypothetical protein
MVIEGLDDLNASIEAPEEETGQHTTGPDTSHEETPNDLTTDPPVKAGEETPPVDEPTTPPVTGEEGAGTGEEGGDNGDAGEGTENLSGIEKYLAKFGIEGGMIQFEDGDQKHFTELDQDKQAEILETLDTMARPDIEEQYGLDEDEVGLINYLRETGMSIEQAIDQMAAQRAQAYITAQQAQTINVDEMDDDTVYASYLLQKNPEMDAEALEKELEAAKKLSNYTSWVEDLRNDIKEAQQMMTHEQQEQARKQMMDEIEEQRQEVVSAVSKMGELDGLKINDGIKNDVLDLILNVDEDGDSLFMTQVFSDPNELFRAAFWYKNGADIIRAREEFWKKEKSAAYKRGLDDAKKGKKTFTSSDLKQNKTTPYLGESDEPVSLDELY